MTAGKNNMVAVSADREANSRFRQIFYPPRARELKIHLQAVNGWVSLDPDPNRGFVVSVSQRPVNQSGRWLRGPMAPSACFQDVKIARALLGHRPWMVSTPRVYAYRALAFAVVMAVAMRLDVDSIGLAALAFLLVNAVPSPCTPRGVMIWCENMGFGESKLAVDKALDDRGLADIRDMIASTGDGDG